MATTYNDIIAAAPIALMAQNRSVLDPATMQILVRQAEDEIIELLDHDAFRTTLQQPAVISPGTDVIDLSAEAPSVLEVRALRIAADDYSMPMERRDIERLNALYPTGEPGVPRFYAEDEAPLVLRVFPPPDQEYRITVTANVEPLRLSPDIQTSVLSQRHPRILEMMVFKHLARFMRNSTDEARYGREAEAALMGVNTQFARRRRDETGLTGTPTANRVG